MGDGRWIWCLRCHAEYREIREKEEWLCFGCEKQIANQFNERIKKMVEISEQEAREFDGMDSAPMAVSKTEQWRQFSAIVEDHIASYAVKQYGDFPDKTIAKFTSAKVQGKLEAYVDRIGKGARGPEEAARDAIKIAHFGCYLYALLTRGDAQADLE
jgi:hypothetical protein